MLCSAKGMTVTGAEVEVFFVDWADQKVQDNTVAVITALWQTVRAGPVLWYSVTQYRSLCLFWMAACMLSAA